jgi:hypothetical protein
MQFLKKHYEKIILGVVLLGLFGAAAVLPMQINEFKEELRVSLRDPVHKARPETEIADHQKTLKQLDTEVSYRLDGPHNLFNPVEWQKGPNGAIKIAHQDDVGPGAVKVLDIRPLYLTIEFISVSGTPERPRYKFSVAQETAKKSSYRRPRETSVSEGRPAKAFRLVSFKGQKENPLEFNLELIEGNEPVTIHRNEQFKKIVGYTADLSYPLENKTKLSARVDDTWDFHRDDYKIVAIDENVVVLSAQSTQKRTQIRWKGTQ